jgi:putative flippase GtrA
MNLANFIDTTVEKILGRNVNKGLLQFFRYLICGGVATVSDMSVLYSLTHFLHVFYLFAAACGFVVGISINYTLNTILVFKSSGKIHREFTLFALIGIGGLIWTEIIIWTLVGKLHFYLMIAKIISVIFVLFWNFFMRKKFVFYAEPVSKEY